MNFYFTRRHYDPATDQFTREDGGVTKYVVLPHERRNAGHIADRGPWLTELRKEMGSNEVLIYIHGFNSTQGDMLWSIRKLKAGVRLAGFNGAIVGFSWPNSEKPSPAAYNRDRQNIPTFASALFTDGVLAIQSMSPRPRVQILCHSLGGYVFYMGFSNQSGARKLKHLAFAAADLDQPWFHPGAQGARGVEAWTERFTNYYSTKDKVLDLSERYVHGDPRVGGDGLPHPTASNQKDVACADRYMSSDHDGKRSLTYSHNFYFSDAQWLRDLGKTLAGQQTDTRGPAPVPPDHVLLP